jgi:hypothetical protein
MPTSCRAELMGFSESMRKGLPGFDSSAPGHVDWSHRVEKLSAPYRSGPSLDQDEELEQPGDNSGARSRMVIGIMAEE